MGQPNTRLVLGAPRDGIVLGALSLATLLFLLLTEPFTGRLTPGDKLFSLSQDEIVTLLLTASVANYLFFMRRRHGGQSGQPHDLKTIRERLRDAEARHRGLVESIPAVIYIDHPGRPWTTTYMSPQIENLLGFTPDEMMGEGSKWLQQIHPDDRARVVAESADHMKSGEPLLSTYRMATRSGDTVWVSRRATIVRDERGRPMFSQGVIFDVTDLKEMEQRLRLLESAVVNARDAIMITDAKEIDHPQGPKAVYVNQAFVAATGYTPEDIVGRRIGIMRGPKTCPKGLQELTEKLKRGESGQLEVLNYRKDGSEHWIEISVNPITDELGRITHLASVQRDTTERKVEDERIRALVRNAADLIWVVAPEGTILWSSPSMETTLGHRPDEVEGLARLDLIHPDDHDIARGALEDVSSEPGKSVEADVRIRHKDGRWRDLQTVLTNLIDHPSVGGIVINANDVTEHKRAENVGREAKQRFRSAFDNAPIGMALAGAEGRILQVNEALMDILGYSEPELLDRTFLDLVHPEEVEDCLDCMRQLAEGSDRVHQMERRFLHKSGRIVQFHVSVSLVRNSQDEPMHYIAQIEDITERRKLEDQLRQAQKMEAVGQLAGGVAHDFNNILSVIQSYGRFVLEAIDPDDPAHTDAEEIVKAGDRATALVRQLLAFSRREISNPVMLDVNDAISGIEKLLRRTIGEDIQLTTRLSEDAPQTTIDTANFEQVIMNLALNSRDAMPNGGLLSIHTDRIEAGGEDSISPTLDPGPYTQITISDTGQGMTSEVLERIYEPFFTTKSRGRGTGLGLSTVYGIVQQAGGDISVRSQPGKGTTFRILLPACDELAPAGLEGDLEAVAPGRNEKVLVVEDESAVRRLVERVLRDHGYSVLVAATGSEAIDIARRSERIDLLVSDVVMPQMSGVTVAETVKSLHPNSTVLFMSGYPDETVAHLGILDGVEMYVQKPFTNEELLGKMRAALDSATAV
ncbi:MAG TPA: PAS domain S-box protein [Actinomycetota bacterium]|nr:PAS domain S-box protein [Actinomycetota bacterium]